MKPDKERNVRNEMAEDMAQAASRSGREEEEERENID